MQDRRESPIILSGIRHGETIGSPIAVYIPNGERARWARIMSPYPVDREGGLEGEVTHPRPGHADLAGAIKYGRRDIRDVLERASARETAARVALGACVKALLETFDITVFSHVVSIGRAVARGWSHGLRERVIRGEASLEAADESPVRCLDEEAAGAMVVEVDDARGEGDTLGGVFEVIVLGVPVGLGSYVQWNRRIDGLIAAAVMSIPGIKGVEIGPGFENAGLRGSEVHDSIYPAQQGGGKSASWFARDTNRAGGVEGGVTNGEEVVVRAAMKPIPTLKRPMATMDLRTKSPDVAVIERGDVCAVPAAAVVGETMVAMVVADLLLDKFGGDSVDDVRAAMEAYGKRVAGPVEGGRGGRS